MAQTGKWTAAQMPSQAGKTVLITGANSGIGYQAALALGRAGAEILLSCRSESKGKAALEQLQREVPGVHAELVVLDVASLASVRAVAAAFLASGRPLDVLINNAGVMGLPSRELTDDGFERQMATNHLGHFALTGSLLPALNKSGAPRVVTVASLAHRNGKIRWDNLQGERRYDPMGAYNNTKLANLLFAFELDRRLRRAGSPVTSVAAHPGVAVTQVFQNGPGDKGDLRTKLIRRMVPLIGQSDAMGALPTEYAATHPGVLGGQYIGPSGFSELKGYPTVVKARPRALDEALAKRLWEVSATLTGVTYLA